ncbi:hypothetical protein ACN2CC_32650 [Mesorhizobium muleiense]|uniref:hypothetical protein n=1 Tax=Mesorhizobium muleiense TaxID=1004279 RepID=UPI003AFAFFAC
MYWTWNWWLFVVALIVITFISMFSYEAMNGTNTTQRGERADHPSNFGHVLLVSLLAGAAFAFIITAVVGFLF